MSIAPQTTPRSCWSRCFWCICTCNGRRISSVGPSVPFPVVSANGKIEADLSGIRTVQVEPSKSENVQYGVINQFFVPDENGVVTPSVGESGTTITVDPEGSNRLSGSGSGSSPEHQLANSIFIEIDKDRRIRVVHLQPRPTSSEGCPQTSTTSHGTQVVQLSPSSGRGSQRKSVPGEEEDEYWFTKWTRKPRFRSIFEKNTIHCGENDEEDEGENNNSVNGGSTSGGALSKDFEMARATAAAARRAWAYNTGSSEPVVQQSTVIDNNEEEEYNSISICESSQKWSKKTGNNKDESESKTPPPIPTPRRTKSNAINSADVGVTNLGYEEDDATVHMDELPFEEVVHEMAVDCPPDFVSPVKSLSLKRGTPSPSLSNSSTIVMMGKSSSSANSNKHSASSAILNVSETETLQNGIQQSLKKTPILFFIHGISESVEVWTAQIEFFHNLGYEIVAPDLLGHGYSSTPNISKHYYFESLAQDLLSVFDYFVEQERKVVILGHGYGASLAAVILGVRPKSCRLLISISGGGPTPLVNRTCCRGSLVPFYCKLFHKNTKKGRFDNPELHHILPTVIHRHVINGQIWADGDSAFYRRISVPTLLVFGMKDKVVNLVEICEMERTIPKSFLEVIDSAGHLVMIDEPGKLNKMLGKFIQSWI